MKRQSIIQYVFNGRNYGLLMTVLFLFTFSVSMAGNREEPRPKKEPIAMFLNTKHNKFLLLNKDSIDVSTKGTLLLGTLSDEFQKRSGVNFWVVIRHRADLGGVMINTGDERYNDGEVFNSIEVEKVVAKAKAGDQIIIVPVDKNSEYENSKTHFMINIRFNGC